jgi:hypothetical protein
MRRVNFFELSASGGAFIVALMIALIWPSRLAVLALAFSAVAFTVATIRALMGSEWPQF